MTDNFKVGDNVRWNSEAARVTDTIICVPTRNFEVNDYATLRQMYLMLT